MNTHPCLLTRSACPTADSKRGRNSIEVLETRIAPAGIVNFSGSGSVVVDLAAHTITDSSAPGSPWILPGPM